MNEINYISFASMGKTIGMNLYKIPQDVDLIVGISQNGLLAGNLLALSLNIPIIDLDGFIFDRKPRHGFSRKTKKPISLPHEARHVLIVEDMVRSSEALDQVKNRIYEAGIQQQMTFCSVYTDESHSNLVDITLSRLSSPAFFEWGIMHSPSLEDVCIDIDGVLCMDPTRDENDDGPAYLNFLKHARPHTLPSHNVGYLVTNRLEKYREETTQWLNKHNIKFKKLHMLDLPDAKTRRSLNIYTAFKAYIFHNYSNSPLFIESEKKQAIEIARLSKKPVFCFSDKQLYNPELLSLASTHTNGYHSNTFSKAKKFAARLFRPGTKQQKPLRNTPSLQGTWSVKNPEKEMSCQP